MPDPTTPQSIVRYLRSRDPVLGAFIKRVGAYTLVPKTDTVFESLLRSIVYQQLSGKAAATIHSRVLALLPKPARLQPAALLELADEQLRAAGLSGNKTLAVRDLAGRAVAGTLPTRRKTLAMTDEQIIESLVQVRGIGRWTAEMLLMFSLGRPDVLPLDDLGIRKGFARVFALPEMPSAKELAAQGELWRPHRTAASWYLWRALELPKETVV